MHFNLSLFAALTLSVLSCLSNPLSARQDVGVINVCNEEPQCTIQCIPPTNGGPVFNDCHVIADTLRYISLASSETNVVGTGTNNTIVMKYQTCKSFFFNSGTVPIEYCRPTWAEKLDEMAALCHYEENSFGGKCVSPKNEWFIQHVLSTFFTPDVLTDHPVSAFRLCSSRDFLQMNSLHNYSSVGFLGMPLQHLTDFE